MKSVVHWALLLVLFGLAVFPAPAAFSSLQVFGDGVCTTTNNTSGSSLYYGNRFCNGSVWVEVLAQRQGLPYYPSNNWSYFAHDSTNLLAQVTDPQFTLPSGASNALLVIWVCDADFVGDIESLYSTTDLPTWNGYLNTSLANHLRVVTNLYAKGARTFLMPNAVDITSVPNYWYYPNKAFIRQRIIDFNTAFVTTWSSQVRTNCPGIRLYIPDFFALFDQMLAQPANFGLLNPHPAASAIYDGYTSLSNGLGTSYIFWDDINPTARAHAVMADIAQALISPAQILSLTPLGASNRLDVASLPVGLSGFVDARASLLSGSWAGATNFNSVSGSQSIFAPATGAPRFYRLRFPFAWSWP